MSAPIRVIATFAVRPEYVDDFIEVRVSLQRVPKKYRRTGDGFAGKTVQAELTRLTETDRSLVRIRFIDRDRGRGR